MVEISESPSGLSKFEQVMIKMENLYYMNRPKYGELIVPKTKEEKEHYKLFMEPKKFNELFMQEFCE